MLPSQAVGVRRRFSRARAAWFAHREQPRRFVRQCHRGDAVRRCAPRGAHLGDRSVWGGCGLGHRPDQGRYAIGPQQGAVRVPARAARGAVDGHAQPGLRRRVLRLRLLLLCDRTHRWTRRLRQALAGSQAGSEAWRSLCVHDRTDLPGPDRGDAGQLLLLATSPGRRREGERPLQRSGVRRDAGAAPSQYAAASRADERRRGWRRTFWRAVVRCSD